MAKNSNSYFLVAEMCLAVPKTKFQISLFLDAEKKKLGLETWEYGWSLTGRSEEGPTQYDLSKRFSAYFTIYKK